MKDSYFTEDAWLNAYVETSKRSQVGDMPLTTWSQLDAWPDGPIPKMCSEVVNGTDIESAIEKCMNCLLYTSPEADGIVLSGGGSAFVGGRIR